MATIRGPGWEINGVTAALIDKDGFLVDSHRYWGEIIRRRAAALTGAFGLGEGADAALAHAMGWDAARQRLRPEGPIALEPRETVIAAVGRALAEYGVVAPEEAIAGLFAGVHLAFLARIDEFVVAAPGAAAFLEALRAHGVRAALVTSDAEENAHQSLDLLGMLPAFEAILGREASTKPKASGEPARLAMAALGVDPLATVCFGDAPMDVMMARAAGCKAGVAVASGQVPLARLRAITPFAAADLNAVRIDAQAAPSRRDGPGRRD